MKAWQLLEKPEAWTRGAPARDAEGKIVDFDSTEATCWCVAGAIEKCYSDPHLNIEVRLRVKSRINNYDWIHKWNDAETTTHSQVLEVLKACDV